MNNQNDCFLKNKSKKNVANENLKIELQNLILINENLNKEIKTENNRNEKLIHLVSKKITQISDCNKNRKNAIEIHSNLKLNIKNEVKIIEQFDMILNKTNYEIAKSKIKIHFLKMR